MPSTPPDPVSQMKNRRAACNRHQSWANANAQAESSIADRLSVSVGLERGPTTGHPKFRRSVEVKHPWMV
jgi:hypothetical protein